MDAEMLIVIAGLAGAAVLFVGNYGIKKAKKILAAKGISDEQGDIGFGIAEIAIVAFEAQCANDPVALAKARKAKEYLAQARAAWENEAVPTVVVEGCKKMIIEILSK